MPLFQSTHLFRGATSYRDNEACVIYFNPRTSFEVRPFPHRRRRGLQNFNPRTSFEVRPDFFNQKPWIMIFQSTHLFRGATAFAAGNLAVFLFQSTHLFRGATAVQVYIFKVNSDFNPRTSFEVRPADQRLVLSMTDFNPRTSFEVRRFKKGRVL